MHKKVRAVLATRASGHSEPTGGAANNHANSVRDYVYQPSTVIETPWVLGTAENRFSTSYP
jgi:hypothetical protein